MPNQLAVNIANQAAERADQAKKALHTYDGMMDEKRQGGMGMLKLAEAVELLALAVAELAGS